MKRLKTQKVQNKKESQTTVPASRVQVSRLKLKPQGSEEVEIYPLVLRLVKRCYKGISEDGRLEYQDLISEAVVAVMECLQRYKPQKKKRVKFTTFAFFRIVGALRDAVRKQDRFGTRNQLVAGTDFDEQLANPHELEVHISNRQLFLRVIEILETKIPPALALILVRSYLEEWSDKELAKELRITRLQLEVLRQKALEGVRAYIPRDRKQFGTWVG